MPEVTAYTHIQCIQSSYDLRIIINTHSKYGDASHETSVPVGVSENENRSFCAVSVITTIIMKIIIIIIIKTVIMIIAIGNYYYITSYTIVRMLDDKLCQ